MPVVGFDHVAITVADVDATVEFYARVLGAEPLFLERWRAGEMPVALMQIGGARLSIHPAAAPAAPRADAPTPGSADLCFLTDQPLAEVGSRLAALGYPIIEGPVARSGAMGPITSIYARDPDSNLIEISAS
jgi:catechol 2,3-dioxygenase-like lactoylglutathione lyase family enzyme